MLVSVSTQEDGRVVVSAPAPQRESMPTQFVNEEEAEQWLDAARALRMVDPRIAGDRVSGTYEVAPTHISRGNEQSGTPQEEQTSEKRAHRWRMQRSYQFPNASNVLYAGTAVGWMVNVLHGQALYGVVRYQVGEDRVAWVESETPFATQQDADQWVHDCFQQLRREHLL